MRDKGGFTLIELIIVIAIMGIIAGGMVALTFPLLKMQKKTATEKELKEIADGLKLYYIDHGCFPNATSWASDLESYVGKSASEISKDGWRKPYHYFGFTPFKPKDKRVQEVNVVSYGANKKEEGTYNSFPGKKNKGSDDIMVSVSYVVLTPQMVDKTKGILEEAAMKVYSKCESRCASDSTCKDSDCKQCVRDKAKKYVDAWNRSLQFDSCDLSSFDQCSCLIYSTGANPINSASSDNIKKAITWSIASSSGSGTNGNGNGGTSTGRNMIGPPVHINPPVKRKGHKAKWW